MLQAYVYILLILQEWNSNHLTDVMTYSVLLVSLTFNIFIFCYIGELVADKVEAFSKLASSFCTQL